MHRSPAGKVNTFLPFILISDSIPHYQGPFLSRTTLGELVSMKQGWVLRTLKGVLWVAREEEGIESEEGRLRKSGVFMTSTARHYVLHPSSPKDSPGRKEEDHLSAHGRELGSCPAPSTFAGPTLHMPCLL